MKKLKELIFRLVSKLMWWRNSEKACRAAEERAFLAAAEGRVYTQPSFKESWNEWEWLFKAITILLGIFYLGIKFYLAAE